MKPLALETADGVSVHPLALVHPQASLGEGVEVGPFCQVGPCVSIGPRTRLVSHVSLSGTTTIGADCTLYPFASIGHPPQDSKHGGGMVSVMVGDRNTFRESVTVHPGSDAGRRDTVIGDDNLFMVGSHVAHECRVGSNVVLTNQVALGGAVEVGDNAVLGGLSAVVQFTRIGEGAFVGGKTLVTRDVIPFGYALGNPAVLMGLNTVGLKRRGVSRDGVRSLRAAFSALYAPEGTFAERVDEVALEYADDPRVVAIVEFIRAKGRKELCRPGTKIART